MNLKLGETLTTVQNCKIEELCLYSDKVMEQVQKQSIRLDGQIRILNQLIKSGDVSSDKQVLFQGKLALLIDQIYRLKRFALLYHHFRCQKMEDQFWILGGNLFEDTKSNMTDFQKQYFSNYKNIAMEYIEEVGVDLTIDLQPPLCTEVQIRVMKDCGQIVDEKGNIIKLQKNSGGSVHKNLVQAFIRKGSIRQKKMNFYQIND